MLSKPYTGIAVQLNTYKESPLELPPSFQFHCPCTHGWQQVWAGRDPLTHGGSLYELRAWFSRILTQRASMDNRVLSVWTQHPLHVGGCWKLGLEGGKLNLFLLHSDRTILVNGKLWIGGLQKFLSPAALLSSCKVKAVTAFIELNSSHIWSSSLSVAFNASQCYCFFPGSLVLLQFVWWFYTIYDSWIWLSSFVHAKRKMSPQEKLLGMS